MTKISQALALLTFSSLIVLFSCNAPPTKEYTQGSVRPDPNLQPGLSRTLSKGPGTPVFNLDKIESSSAPLFANSSVPVVLPPSSDLVILGWAIDKAASAPAGGVDVAIDGTAWQAPLNLTRPDVVSFFKNPVYLNTGFQFKMRSGAIAPGNHALTIRVISNDKHSYMESLPLRLVLE